MAVGAVGVDAGAGEDDEALHEFVCSDAELEHDGVVAVGGHAADADVDADVDADGPNDPGAGAVAVLRYDDYAAAAVGAAVAHQSR